MKKLYPNFLKRACALLLLIGASQTASAQTASPAYCPTLTGLPDTFFACKNTRPLLPIAQIGNIQSGTQILDTLWNPRATLTDPDSIATQAYVDLTSINYTLTVTSRRPNIAVNSTFDLGNTGFTTDYYLKTNTLPAQPRFYMVTDSPSKANPAFADIPDHGITVGAGGNGMMMVVNGATQPNKVVWAQTISVIPGETYELNAYAATLTLSGNQARLGWRINGTAINYPSGLPFTGLSASYIWQPLLIRYYNPAATSMTVEIVNYETSPDPGNDFALDDITVQPLCIQKDSVYVKAINLRPLIRYNAYPGCDRDTIDFFADTSIAGTSAPPATLPTRYLWDFGDGQTSTQQNPRHFYIIPQDTFKIKLYVYWDGTNANGQSITCVDSTNNIYTGRVRLLEAGFTQDKDSICKGDVISFTDTSKPNTLQPVYYFAGAGTNQFFDTTKLKNFTYTFDTAGVFDVVQVITDQYGCTDTARNRVVVVDPTTLAFSLSDTVICEGETIIAQTLIDSSYRQYTWNFDDGRIVYDSTKITHTYLKAGAYDISFSATHNICPNVTKTRPLIVLETPRVNLGTDTFLCPNGQPILLQNLYPFNSATTTYLWNTGDQTPQILVRHDGTFYLTASNPLGCSATDTVEIARNCFLDIPNAFRPGIDGSNGYFMPRQILTKGLMTFKMTIFNRWGQKVFETARTDGRGWDGKFNGMEQPTGVYLYFIEATLQNGATEKYEGDVTLLR